jgi:hypothetical protein
MLATLFVTFLPAFARAQIVTVEFSKQKDAKTGLKKGRKGDMLYSSCQEKNEQLRNINSYNMIDNTHFPEHTYP